MTRSTIAWTRQKLEDLKTAYDAAIKAGETEFVFVEKNGTGMFAREIGKYKLLTSYAKYLIEYLETEFAAHPDQPAQPNHEGREGQ